MSRRYINIYQELAGPDEAWASSPYPTREEADDNRGGQYPGSSIRFLACIEVDWLDGEDSA